MSKLPDGIVMHVSPAVQTNGNMLICEFKNKMRAGNVAQWHKNVPGKHKVVVQSPITNKQTKR